MRLVRETEEPEGPRKEEGMVSDGPSDWGGTLERLSEESLEAARAALRSPRTQLRSAVALQVGQLSELSSLLVRFLEVVEKADASWTAWTERGLAAQEALGLSLRDLATAKARQEEALVALRQGVIAAKDEDTARLEVGLRNLAMAAQDLRSATETAGRAGKRFQAQVQEALLNLERRLPESADLAARRLEEPITTFQKAVRPLAWIGGTLTILLVADLLARVLK